MTLSAAATAIEHLSSLSGGAIGTIVVALLVVGAVCLLKALFGGR